MNANAQNNNGKKGSAKKLTPLKNKSNQNILSHLSYKTWFAQYLSVANEFTPKVD
jgi:hypothetical protein